MKIIIYLSRRILIFLAAMLAGILTLRSLPGQFGLVHRIVSMAPESEFVFFSLLMVSIIGSLAWFFWCSRQLRPWKGGVVGLFGYLVWAAALGRYVSYLFFGQAGVASYLCWGALAWVFLFFLPVVVDLLVEGGRIGSGIGRKTSVGGLILAIAVLVIVYGIVGQIQFREREADTYAYTHPVITSFEPHMVTTWNKIIIRGSGFGTRINNDYRVEYGNGEQLLVDYWSDNEIIIELSVVRDPLEIRVVRPSDYKGKVEDRASNPIKLEFYEVGEATPEQQKQYFDQLNSMSDEAKKLYGINTF